MDKHMQNEKELIRLRRFMPARRELPEPGARNFACGANYLATRVVQFCLRRKLPAPPGTKRGAILYLCGE